VERALKLAFNCPRVPLTFAFGSPSVDASTWAQRGVKWR
jgi:hypothetical protein